MAQLYDFTANTEIYRYDMTKQDIWTCLKVVWHLLWCWYVSIIYLYLSWLLQATSVDHLSCIGKSTMLQNSWDSILQSCLNKESGIILSILCTGVVYMRKYHPSSMGTLDIEKRHSFITPPKVVVVCRGRIVYTTCP